LFLFPGHPKTDAVKMLIAKSYYNGEKYKECASYIESQSLQSRREKIESVFLLGDCYVKMKYYQNAMETFKGIKETSNDELISDIAFLRIANINILQGKWEKAAAAYRGVKGKMSALAEKAAKEVLKGKVIPEKSTVTAGVLAALLPGAGHLYVGRRQDAVVSFVLNGAFIWGIIRAFTNNRPVLGGILSFFELGWYGGNINGAVNSAYKLNKKRKHEFRKKMKSSFNFSFNKPESGGKGFFLSWEAKF